MLIAAGAVAAIGYGAYTLLGQSGTRGTGQLGTFLIRDAYSGEPLPGAQVTVVPLACADSPCSPAESTPQGVVGRMFKADASGSIHPRLGSRRVTVLAAQREYDGQQVELPWPPTEPATLALRPNWVAGRVTALGQPLAGAKVQALVPGQEQGVVGATDKDGRYRLSGVPDGASLLVDAP